jgi:hypothetical protein
MIFPLAHMCEAARRGDGEGSLSNLLRVELLIDHIPIGSNPIRRRYSDRTAQNPSSFDRYPTWQMGNPTYLLSKSC